LPIPNPINVAAEKVRERKDRFFGKGGPEEFARMNIDDGHVLVVELNETSKDIRLMVLDSSGVCANFCLCFVFT
jgi:hypothetical protein